jgi:glycerate dehydrogenase
MGQDTVRGVVAQLPLLTARNRLMTPHIAWATREVRRRLLEATVANVASFRAGRQTNVVNLPMES